MICPDCGALNADGAKFCKKCGRQLIGDSNNSPVRSEPSSGVNQQVKSSFLDDNKNLLIICLTIIIIAIVVAGGFILLSGNNSDDSTDVSTDASSINLSNDSDTPSEVVETTTSPTAGMKILSGSFSTGSGMSDKTYCTVYVGEQYAGESVKISVLYSSDGSNLNQGKIIPKTVTSDGYVSVPSADAFRYYPDHAIVKIYDRDGNVLDTQEVSMTATSGTQSF